MLNTTNNNSKTVINTPASGIIQKSNDKSFFLILHQNSRKADKIFHHIPEYADMKVIVIQTLLLSEGQIMVEIVKESDFK